MKLLLVLCLQFSLLSSSVQDKPVALTPAEFKEMTSKEKGRVIDVRTPEEFQAGHLKKAQNVDWRGGKFQEEFQNWDKSQTYYLYCATGNRSSQALKMMQEAGFKYVYNVGGYKDLKAAGLKTSKKN
ncbi:rhodanese-like domain-containing protein [Rufibacter ruber]|uniref:rhodanese-like domain-containing protein n=1 Tax=Rufibacter ruber TaxID=1783499 RepID=UPI0009EDAE0F|nr:rhodanese-like domain-containing protein [Rufibacter ruber]